MSDGGGSIFSGLLDRGFSPVHAAAITGNIQQESGFNPAAVNPGEDAHGLLQWRLDRWQGLQDFAKTRGVDPADQNTQLDFIRHEMGGAESRSGNRFLAATDLPSANTALKGYIRYGDQSQGVRLANAQPFLLGNAPTMGGAPQPPQTPQAPQMAPQMPQAQAPQLPQAAAPQLPAVVPQGQQPAQQEDPNFWQSVMASQAQLAPLQLLPGRPPPPNMALLRALTKGVHK